MFAQVECLVDLWIEHRFVVAGKHRHGLGAAHLQQDVVFGIEVERRDRARRRDEDEAFAAQHRAGAGRNNGRDLVEDGIEQLRVVGMAFDPL